MRGHLCRWPAAIAVAIGLCGLVSAQTGTTAEPITLIAGRSTVINAPWPTVRVAVTDPLVAGVQVLTPEQVLVQGLKVGSTDLILWSENQTQTWQRRVVVRLDIEKIQTSLARLFPDAELTVSDSGDVLLVQGLLRRADQVVQLKDYLEKTKIPYVDMTSLAGIQQVQLQVRVAEVSRVAMRQLGFNFVGTGNNFFYGQKIGQVTPSIDIGPAGQVFPTPQSLNDLAFATPDRGITAGSSVTLFGGFPGSNFEFYLAALAENQYMRILANPTLVALSGEEANFLAGGEFPIPVPQTSGGGTSQTITIEYKEYGVLLAFQPIVLGDGTIRLRASQEVSELSQAGAVVIQGFSVPALTTRRAEATLELQSGQSFAMAGLLRRTDAAVASRIPGLGDLPVLGPLFRSIQYQNQQTELVILVTASLVEPMSLASAPPLPGAAHAEPNDWEFYIEGRLEGKKPARIDPVNRQWLKDMGLDRLAGPGAWDTYEEQTYPELARTAEASQAEPAAEPAAEKETEKPAGTSSKVAAPLLGSPEGQAGATAPPPDKKKADAPQP
jgi:pilus assembly protein CpaC